MIAHAIDVILVLVILEGIALVVLHRRTGQGPAPRRVLGTLAAGFFLMLATRLALDVGPDAPLAAQAPVAGCLLAALVAHLTDFAIRWRG